jgi:bifunctional DNA-binding transcriptional regulator/antitoxin component of YhaV-PrlF toxin-antitoxin module
MQLQKHLNRVVADKEYAKYLLVIPPETVHELKWQDGQKLKHEVKDESLIIRKADPEVSDEEALKESSKYRRRTFRRR